MDEHEGRPGPKAWYRPKGDPMSIAVTDETKATLDQTCEREEASRGDVIEQLVRRFAHKVRRPRWRRS